MLTSLSKTSLSPTLKSFNKHKFFHSAPSFVDLFVTFSFTILYKNIIYVIIYIYIYKLINVNVNKKNYKTNINI